MEGEGTLTLEIPEIELYDEKKNLFIEFPSKTVKLEHSLYSLSKWESKWKKPYFSKLPIHEKTMEEIEDYILCMDLDGDLTVEDVRIMPKSCIDKISDYINDPMTATTFNDEEDSSSMSIDTAEIYYYMMVELGIPFECQYWNLNRLFTLIKVCVLKRTEAQGGKKMSKRAVMDRNRELNEKRRAEFKTKG